MHFNRNILYKTTMYMNNSNRESTSFIYKKILSQLNPLNDKKEDQFCLIFYRSTLVGRPFHLGGTIVSQPWNDRITRVKR